MFQEIPSVINCDVLQKIKEHDVISFDIFDTAIIRPFTHHADMYFIVEKLIENKKFQKMRIKAEQNTRKELIFKKNLKEEVTILDIYDHLHLDKQHAINTEIGLDVEICRKRNYVFKLYNFAIGLSKRVIFTTDITYPRNTIEEILHKNGYTKYERIFISSEENLSKHQGGLYKKLAFEMNVTPHRILHIGDSIKADVHQAQQHGLHPMYIPRPLHSLQKVLNIHQFSVKKKAINSALFGSAANVMFNNPLTKVHEKHLYTFPFIYKLTLETIKHSKANNNLKPIFLIHEGESNGLYHLFCTVQSFFLKEAPSFIEVDLAQIYAGSIRTFEDLTNLKVKLSDSDFQHMLSLHFNIKTNSTEELQSLWLQIEQQSLIIRKEIVERYSFLKEHLIYDFTFENNTHDFLQSLLNFGISHYFQAHNILTKQIAKETKRFIFTKPNPQKIILEMLALTNEETQRFIMPQIEYFFATLGKYVHLM